MQLFDYIFWTKQPDNEITTKFASIFNHLQPIALAYLIYKYKGYLKFKTLVIIYVIFSLIYTVDNWNELNSSGSPIFLFTPFLYTTNCASA